MNGLLLLDVPSDPSGVGIGVLAVLAIVVLAIVAVLIGGFVFLLVWRKRRHANAALGAVANVPQSGS